MDVSNRELTKLLDKTDQAFKQLMQEPGSIALNSAYESAKQELDFYLCNMREDLKKRYKDF
ncbi:hypothetical protein [Aliiglaciecola sp. LCG003]|uniref:hypothetical protein n=1 Tax=Aliiglaciecola sp. LCG003 TaxID=3053655 RepID=UPI002573D6AC|nr:hypothetical protein [Aliiglaciecola sp. LCG003]WJG08922.1 hypothetical protein QR722_16530 [Aliiglaciecola sp. LCG003]